MQRTIKSYVLRTGRVSPRQQRGFDQWLNDYRLPEPPNPWCLDTMFNRPADTIVEIGFGMGQALLATAIARPELNYIGIEVHRAGIGSLAADLHEHAIEHVKIAPYDAMAVFQSCVADNSLAGVQIFFPDPWPKKRHHKRRLIQPDFIHLLVNKIKIGGFIHCATDWQDYAEQMHRVLASDTQLQNQQEDNGFAPRPVSRPLTNFEQRGCRLGHGVWDLIFLRKSNVFM